MPLTRITSNVIQDGTIVNADISSSTLIDRAKLQLTSPAGVKTVYLAPRTDGVAGSGTELDPYDASTAQKFEEILLNRTKIPAGSTVRLLEGQYYSYIGVGWVKADGTGTGGAGMPNISIIGNGMNSTKIQGVQRPSGINNGNMFGICGKEVVFSDMTIDCGRSAMRSANTTIGAIAIQGGQCSIIERIRVINFGGDLTTGAEGFPIYISGNESWPQVVDGANVSNRGAVIRNCIVEQPDTWNSGGTNKAYYTAISSGGSIYGASSTFPTDGISVIENNVIIGAVPNNHNYGTTLVGDTDPMYEFGVTVGGVIKNLIVKNNTFKNLALATQCDTWLNQYAFIESNYCDQVGLPFLINCGVSANRQVTIPNSGAGNPVVITMASNTGFINYESDPNYKQVVKFYTTDSLPSPLNSATTYFVRYVSPTTFRLSETMNGPFISTTTNGSGTHYAIVSAIENLTISGNTINTWGLASSSLLARVDSSLPLQKCIIEKNWVKTKNPNEIIGVNRNAYVTFSSPTISINNCFYSNIPTGYSNISINSYGNTDENGIEIFLGLDRSPTRTVKAKFSDPKKNGIAFIRALGSLGNPFGISRSATNKSTLYVEPGEYEYESFLMPNYIEIIGTDAPEKIRLKGSKETIFFAYSGISSTIKNLTLIATDGYEAYQPLWTLGEETSNTVTLENIIFTKPVGGTGRMVSSGSLGMRGGTWINCKSEFPMYDTSSTQGQFFGKMYNCNFPAGSAVQSGSVVPTEIYNSVLGGPSLNIGTSGIMQGCTTNLTDSVYATGAKFERCTFNNKLALSGTNKLFNSTIETSQTNSITGTATVVISASQSNKPVAGTITVTQLNSL